MTHSRLRNPLHNLTQTANDLIQYLKEMNREKFIEIVTPVIDMYAAPTKSWVWYWFYSRVRIQFLNEMINEVNKTNEKIESNEKSDEKSNEVNVETKMVDAMTMEVVPSEIMNQKIMNQNSMLAIVNQIIKTGGWEETSFNTNLIRALLNILPEYDHAIQLSLNEIKTLSDLLCMDITITKAVDKLVTINAESHEVGNSGIESVMQEVKLVAEAAIKDFLMEKEKAAKTNKEISQKQKELNTQIRDNLVKCKETLTSPFGNNLYTKNQKQQQGSEEEREKREADVREACLARTKEKNAEVKAQLLKRFSHNQENPERVKRAQEAEKICARSKAETDGVKAILLNHFNKNNNKKFQSSQTDASVPSLQQNTLFKVTDSTSQQISAAEIKSNDVSTGMANK